MTAFALREGVTFCRIGENNVFLDIVSDRYFCLQRRLNAAFTDLIEHREVDPPAVGALRASGILVEAASSQLAACHVQRPTAGDWQSQGNARLPDVARAVISRARWTWRVRNHSLAENIVRLQRQRSAGCAARHPDPTRIAHLAAAYSAAGVVWSEYNRCLPTAMALVENLARSGHCAQLVFGVHLQPFHAHCWVELAGSLVTDDPDRVGQFTPIRVV